jgi:transcriptional accessory protein Tex/SPT6
MRSVQLVYTAAAALEQAAKTLGELLNKHRPFAIAVGNGTHGRESRFCPRRRV